MGEDGLGDDSKIRIGRKRERDGIHTVPLIGRRWESLPLEDMPEVPATGRTSNFNPSPIGILGPMNSPGESLKEGRPSTPRLEFCC